MLLMNNQSDEGSQTRVLVTHLLHELVQLFGNNAENGSRCAHISVLSILIKNTVGAFVIVKELPAQSSAEANGYKNCPQINSNRKIVSVRLDRI